MAFFDFLDKPAKFASKYTKGIGDQMFKSGTDVLKVGIGAGEQIAKTTGSIVKPPLKLADKATGGFLTQMKKTAESIPKAFKEKILAPSMIPTDMVEQSMKGELKREDGSNILVEDLPWWAQAHYVAMHVPRTLASGSMLSVGGGLSFLEWQGLDAVKGSGDKMESWAKIAHPEDMTGVDMLVGALGSSLPYYAAGQFSVGLMGITNSIAPKVVIGAFGSSLSGFMESAAESGSIYKELKDKGGYSDKEIDKRASQNFWLNAIVISAMNAIGGLYTPGTGGTTRKLIMRSLKAAPFEGIQEGIQQFLGNIATDKPVMEGVFQSIGIGMLVAGILGLDTTNMSPQSQNKIQKMILDDKIINPKTVATRLSDISNKVNMILNGDPNQMTDLGNKITELQKGNLEFVDSPGQFYSEVAKVIKENIEGEVNIKNIVDPVQGVGGYRSKGHLGGDMAFGEGVLYITPNHEAAEVFNRQTGNQGVDEYKYWATPDEILDLSNSELYDNYAKRALQKYKPYLKQNAQGNAIRDLAKSEGYKVIVGESQQNGTAILDKSVLNPPTPKTSNELLERMLSVQSGLAGTVNDMWNSLKIDPELYNTLDADGKGLYIAKEEKAIVDNVAKKYKMTQDQAIKFVGMLFEAQVEEAQEKDNTPDVIKEGITKAQISLGQNPDIINQAVNIASNNVEVGVSDVQLPATEISPARPTGTGDTVLTRKESPQPISVSSEDFNIRNFTDNTALEKFIEQQKPKSLTEALETAGYDGYRIGDEVIITNKEALDEGMKSKQFISTKEALAQSESFKFIQDLNIPVIMKERIRSDKGQEVFGKYSNELIEFINNPHKTTVPHEAVHAFMDLMMTPEERAKIIEEVNRRYPNKKYSDLEATEKLAQDFAEYYVAKAENVKATAPSSKIKQLFDWLINKFKNLVKGADKIEQFYKDVESKAPGSTQVREIERRRVLRGGDALRDIQATYYQNPEKFTLKFFNYKGLNKREFASYQFLIDLLKNAPLKQGEKDLITDVLSQPQFKDNKKIRMQELKDAIIAEILPVEIIPTDRWADYGVAMGDRTISNDLSDDIRMVKTYVLNTPFEHKYTGHFTQVYSDLAGYAWKKEDFKILPITKEQALAQGQTVNSDKYFVVDKDFNPIPSMTEQQIQPYVHTVKNTEELAQQWIDETVKNVSSKIAKKIETPKGLLSHVRIAYMEDGTAKVLEIQSDTIQKMSKEDLRVTMDSLADEYKQIIKGYIDRNIELNKQITARGDKVSPVIREKINEVRANEVMISDYNVRIAALEGTMGNVNIKDLQKIKYSKQFLTYYNIWHEITTKQAIRIAAMENATSLQFPTAFTASLIEGWIEQSNDDVGAEYTEEDIVFGNEIEIFGEGWKITQVYGDGSFSATNELSETSHFTQDELETDVRERMFDEPDAYGILERVKLVIQEDFSTWKKERLVKFNEQKKSLQTVISKMEKTGEAHGWQKSQIREIDTSISALNVLTKNDVENLDDNTLRDDHNANNLFAIVFEDAVDTELEDFDYQNDLEGIYSDVFYNDGVYIVTSEKAEIQNFPPPSEQNLPTDIEDARLDFESETDLSNKKERFGKLDDQYQGMAYRYEVTIPRYLTKLRGAENVEEVVDPYKFSWFETPIISEDKGAVEMFQTKESLQENEEDFELREEARKIVAEQTKSEKKTVKQLIRAAIGKADQDKIERTEQQLLKLKLQNIVRGVKIGRQDMRLIMNGALKQKVADIQLIKEAIIQYADPLPNTEKGKLLTVLKNAKTTTNLDNAFTRIDAALLRTNKVEVLTILKKTVKKARQILKGKSSVDVSFQHRLLDILEEYDFKKPTEKTLKNLTSLKEFLEAQPEEETTTYLTDINGNPLSIKKKYIQQYLIDKVDRLSKTNVSDMTAEDIMELNDTILGLIARGKLKKVLSNNNDERTFEHNRDKLVASTTNLDTSGFLEEVRFDLRQEKLNRLHPVRVTDKIDGSQSYHGENALWQKSLTIAAQNGVLEKDAIVITTLSKINKFQTKFTPDEKIGMMFHLALERGNSHTQLQAMINYYGLKEIPVLTENQKTAMDIMRDVYESYVDRVASVSEEVTGEMFEREKFYFPYMYRKETTMIAEPIIGKKIKSSVKMEQGFTFRRKKNVKRVLRDDVFAVFEESIGSMMNMIHVQPVLLEIHKLVNSQEYKEAAGELVTGWWRDYLPSVANLGQLPGVRSNRILKKTRKNLGLAILGYKLTSTMVQWTAVFPAMSMAMTMEGGGLVAASRVLLHFASTWINPRYAKKVMAQSPHIQLRQGGELALKELDQSNRGKGFINAYQRGALKVLRWADYKTAAGVDQAFYRIFKAQGLDDKQARAEADLFTGLTQATAFYTDLPLILMKGEGLRTLLTFQTFMLNIWGFITEDIVRSGMIHGDIGRKAKSLIALLILALGFSIEKEQRRALWKLVSGKEIQKLKKGETKTDRFISDTFWSIPETVPFLGNILQARREWGASPSVPLTRAIDTVFIGFKMLSSDNEETKKKGVLRISEAFLSLLGVAGTAQAFDFIERAVVPPGRTTDLMNVSPELNGYGIPKIPSMPSIPTPPMPKMPKIPGTR